MRPSEAPEYSVNPHGECLQETTFMYGCGSESSLVHDVEI